MGERIGIRGKWAQRDLWAAMEWEGQGTTDGDVLPDGTDPSGVVATYGPEAVPFPIWYRQSQYSRNQRQGDILWACGLANKLVSRRFADRVFELGVTGCRTYEVELYDRRMRPIEGYVGFVEDPSGEGELAMEARDWPTTSMVCSRRVLDGLLEVGIDQFEIDYSLEPLF
ncbi:hypothetical protein K8P10_000886 [Leucobacter sp. Psy1]|uniref:hypothetical protein n=1 Tax=Leucobacter sp. Psy1 TaxID=2875729 RepID=UPI001CD358C3|nr:hypothetical protein [Leucobacter sp. Psy1]UBH05375.1 hypothetical protein K8P10_000886 [Leucobacter sp. Psy1]